VLVIVNRRAGTVKATPLLPELLRRATGTRGEVAAPEDLPELLRTISRARVQGVDTIAVCGGDGTNHVIATAISTVYGDAAWPRLILMPGGTLNTVAHNLGCMAAPPELLSAILASEEPTVVSRPMLQVNEHTGFIFGSHMVARVLDVYYATDASMSGAAKLTARIVASAALGTKFSRDLFGQEATTIEVEGTAPTSGRYTCLLASTVASPAAGIRALPRAGEDDGFHLIGTEESPTRIFREAGRIFCGLPLKTMSVDVVARRATLTYESDCRYTVDGDLFTAKQVSLLATPPVDILLPTEV
jgi:diacylglycerol kinase family enzyme